MSTPPLAIRKSRLRVPFRDSSAAPFDAANLVCWYDATDLTGANLSVVSHWPDRSGNGNDLNYPASPKASSAPPILTTSAQGGAFAGRKNSVWFGGTVATTFHYLYAGPFAVPVAQPLTMYSVFICGDQYYGAMVEGGSADRPLWYVGYYGYWLAYAGLNLEYPEVQTTTWDCGALMYYGPATTADHLGSNHNQVAGDVGPGPMRDLYLGGIGLGLNGFDGAVQEYRVYRGQHTPLQITQMQRHLASKWNIPT